MMLMFVCPGVRAEVTKRSTNKHKQDSLYYYGCRIHDVGCGQVHLQPLKSRMRATERCTCTCSSSFAPLLQPHNSLYGAKKKHIKAHAVT